MARGRPLTATAVSPNREGPAFPTVPETDLADGGWNETDATVETVFQLPTASVEGATLVYDDERTRGAVREAAGIEFQWRFFFATRLTFRPPLPPGIGTAMVLPTVRSEARQAFADRLRDRGFTDIDRGARERFRVASGERARATKYRATLEPGEIGGGLDTPLPVEGWVAVWNADGVRIAGGAYPARPLADVLAVSDGPAPLDRTAGEYREELLGLIKEVR
ncbi:MAG: hypothetical protein ABEH35_06840 [Haloarculaceae archaeon]